MTPDIIASIGTLLGTQSSTVSARLGESEEGTNAGLHTIVPALLASLVSKGADTRGARELLGKLNSSAVDPGLPGNLADMLGNRGGFDALIQSGQGLLGYLIGGRTGAVSDAVSRVSGIKSSSASALLGMAAPLLFAFLKKHVTDGGLDAGGLKSLLMGQTPVLQKMDLDPRVTTALGIPDLQEVLGIHGHVAERTDSARAHVREAATYPERRGLGWMLGLAGLVLVAGVLWALLGGSRETRSPGVAGEISAVSVGRMSVSFDPGRTVLDGDDWTVIDSAAKAARRGERGIVLTGATPRTGDASQNLALAEQRVAAVRDGLVAKGVPEMRIVIQPPVPASDTDARAQRVQIELRAAP
jgi:outer membrane protein OmpA-like peptidoglycan-associated protein